MRLRPRQVKLLAGIGVLALLALAATLVFVSLDRQMNALHSDIRTVSAALATQASRIDTSLATPAGSVVLVGDSVFGSVTAIWRVRADSLRAADSSDLPARTLFDVFRNAGPSVLILAKGRHDSTLVVDDGMVGVMDGPMDLSRPVRVRLEFNALRPSGDIGGYLMTVPWRVIPIYVRQPGA